MRKRNLLVSILTITALSLCACGSNGESTKDTNIVETTEKQSNTSAETTSERATTEEDATEEITTEEMTTEEETTTAPKITQCQDIKDTTYVDIFTLEGIDGPKPIEFSFGIADVFGYSVPTICQWDKDAKVFFAESNGANENNEYFAMHVDAGHVGDDDSYEKCLANIQTKQLEEESNGNKCHLAYNDMQKNLAYYIMKKEYETIEGMDVVKYNIRIAYYQYDASATLYTDFYAIFDYEITKPLSIENIESIVEGWYSRDMYEYDMCMAYGLMPK